MADVEITPEVLQEVGRRAAAARRQVQAVCALPGCGTEFVGTVRRRYCSQEHQLADYYRRHQADQTEKQRERRKERRATASPGPAAGPAPLAVVAPTAAGPEDAASPSVAAPVELRELVAEGWELLAGVGSRLAADASPPAPAVLPAPSDPSEGGRSSG